MRDYQAADAALRPLLQQRPVPADVQVQVGLLHARRGNEAGARAAFEAALDASPESLEALSGLVTVDLERQQVAAARQRIDRVATNRKDDPQVLKIASRVFRAEGDLRGAEAALRRALERLPADGEAALLLADCLSAGRRHADAKQVLDQLLERQPSSVAAQLAVGAVLERMGRRNEAEARYERILAEDPGSPTAAARLALLHVSGHKNLDVTLSFLGEARRTSPEDPDVLDALGWVYLHKDLGTLAIRNLEDAARANPRHPGYQYHLGVAYARLGQPQNARTALARSLALDEGFAERPQAEAAIAALPR